MAERMQRRPRQASPERWTKAAGRAIAEGVEVRQIASTGQWIATSGTQSNVCYLLEVVAGVVGGCTCPAGEFGDPVCKHAAAFYLAAGLMDPGPPTPAAPACRFGCGGRGYHADPDGRAAPERCPCRELAAA
ncbi:MAG: SWIM zinc finger family protein [Chloroflexia bacterium]|nr:SWIM zinc finger family protein [Chloroflexia bacterium]